MPVLLWVWRLASTRHQVRVPSLVPFESLLRRAPVRRTRLVTNLLFWLQLAALLGLTVALIQPALPQRAARTTLVVLDTSSSMQAGRPISAFERGKQALMAQLARASPTEQFFIMASAPTSALTPQPTSDRVALMRVLQDVRVSALGGHLATTARIGRALLGTAPDRTLVITDEPAPADGVGDGVRFITVGEPVPNAAIVGIDAQGAFCTGRDARLIATVHNFSAESRAVSLSARQHGRRLAESRLDLAPHARAALPLTLPADTTGTVELVLEAPGDGLEADNVASVDLAQGSALPIVVRSDRPEFTRAIATWLDACEALAWGPEAPTDGRRYLLIADGEGQRVPSASSTMMFLTSSAQPMLSRWMVSPDHPVGSYLDPLMVVAAPLTRALEAAPAGTPVIAALLNGLNSPVALVEERDAHRSVSLLFSPVGGERSTPLLLVFLNSLRWLMGRSEAVAVGDPLESNLLERVSTWRPLEEAAPAARATRVDHPVANLLVLLVVLVLLAEWWRYAGQGRHARPPAAGK